MILEIRALPPFMKNGFVLGCEATREGVVIDPGDEVDLLLATVEQHALKPLAILLTHAHLDHVTGVARAKAVLNVPVWLHEADNFLYAKIAVDSVNTVTRNVYAHVLINPTCDSKSLNPPPSNQ